VMLESIAQCFAIDQVDRRSAVASRLPLRIGRERARGNHKPVVAAPAVALMKPASRRCRRARRLNRQAAPAAEPRAASASSLGPRPSRRPR
jgi:hypothetical protein